MRGRRSFRRRRVVRRHAIRGRRMLRRFSHRMGRRRGRGRGRRRLLVIGQRF